ncbi:MAG TPA: LytTR family transcriptional regulator [Bacillus bacterium]|nr:LytTR family transcriptional regulator [Bacillus sp. (in: firmicutes)]
MSEFSLSILIDVIGELFLDETSIAVSNDKEYLYYRPSKRINLKIKPGDPIKEGTITYKALKTGQKVSEYISRDVYGVPYHGTAVPFTTEGKKGCITAVFPTLTSATSIVTVKVEDGWIPVPFNKVVYLEAKNRKTYVITENCTGTHKDSLNEFDYYLPKETFIRCHRSFIVNVTQIKMIQPDTHSTFLLEMNNGTEIPVSQSYSSYFRKLLGL